MVFVCYFYYLFLDKEYLKGGGKGYGMKFNSLVILLSVGMRNNCRIIYFMYNEVRIVIRKFNRFRRWDDII